MLITLVSLFPQGVIYNTASHRIRRSQACFVTLLSTTPQGTGIHDKIRVVDIARAAPCLLHTITMRRSTVLGILLVIGGHQVLVSDAQAAPSLFQACNNAPLRTATPPIFITGPANCPDGVTECVTNPFFINFNSNATGATPADSAARVCLCPRTQVPVYPLATAAGVTTANPSCMNIAGMPCEVRNDCELLTQDCLGISQWMGTFMSDALREKLILTTSIICIFGLEQQVAVPSFECIGGLCVDTGVPVAIGLVAQPTVTEILGD